MRPASRNAVRAAMPPGPPCTPPPGWADPRREVEALHRRLGPAQPGDWPPDQLLVDRGRPTVECTAEQVAVSLFESERSVHVAADDPVTEARRKALDLRLE